MNKQRGFNFEGVHGLQGSGLRVWDVQLNPDFGLGLGVEDLGFGGGLGFLKGQARIPSREFGVWVTSSNGCKQGAVGNCHPFIRP